ncbi:ABC transporter permease/ATP-binding protein CydC [Gordonia hirsuta DSM 44140 = NBRC 16056]|uniref:ABC transporter permease/ATP-binding protein CydC n=1 Tax=Gordonia hirsuta DSM 44140 = NBRC 16056 TaxID=1121927 RepID=L7LAP3_9ACTN|nr:thiol reductant ABC exporter subunit CydC [Gordonia hirsuta]GAC57959.1 ABC transporter permease/ATP-binding protein CydC [Gordonia hirsuta DSM 44140 = NBRC 16056]
MSGDPMIRALRFFGVGTRPLVVSVLFGAAGALSALGLAALSAWLITRAWQMPPVLYLAVAVTSVRALGISRALFRYLERLATHDTAFNTMANARTRIYRSLADGSPAYSVGLRQSQLLARTADDVDDIGSAMIRGLIPMAVGAVTSIAAVAIMAVVSPLAAVVLAIALLVSGVLAPWLAAHGSSLVLDRSARAREEVAEETSALLWHGPELVVAGRRQTVLGDLQAADDRVTKTADAGAAWQVSAASATPLALGVSVVAAALIAVDLASGLSGSLMDVSSLDTRFTPMLFGVLVLLPLSSFEMTGSLTEAGIAWQAGRQAARRVLGLVDDAGATVSRPDPVIDPAPTALAARGLQWGWDRRLGPADGLDLLLEPGERLVVVGRSGCGKSTLLMTLAGLLAPLDGEITARHRDGHAVDLEAATCYFAEEAHIFSTSVRENLLVACGAATDGQIMAALDGVGLSPWVAGLPEGLDTDLHGGGAALSGGQRRRLLLARALLHPAPIVLLDEPAEHLDIEDARVILERICSRGQTALFGPDRIVVLVTHQHAVAAGAAGARLLSLGEDAG